MNEDPFADLKPVGVVEDPFADLVAPSPVTEDPFADLQPPAAPLAGLGPDPFDRIEARQNVPIPPMGRRTIGVSTPTVPPIAPPVPQEALIGQLLTPLPSERDLRAKALKEAQAEGAVLNKERRDVRDLGNEKTWPEVLPFIGGAVKAFGTGKLYLAAKRYEKDGNEADEKVLADFHKKQRELEAPESMGHAVGNILMDLPAFGVELGFTGPAYKGAAKGTEEFLLRAAYKASEKAIEKAAVKAAAKAAGVVAGTAVQTPLARPGPIVASTFANMMPGIGLVDGPDGKQQVVLDEAVADPFLKALYKGYGGEAIGVFTEKAGGGLNKIPGVRKLAALKAAVLSKYIGRHSNTSMTTLINKVKDQAHWDGVLAELAEEELDQALRYGAGIDENYQATSLKDLQARAIAFLVPGAGSLALQKGAASVEARKRQNRLSAVEAYRGSPKRAEDLAGIRANQQAKEDFKQKTALVDLIMAEGSSNRKLTDAVVGASGVEMETRPAPSGLPSIEESMAAADIPLDPATYIGPPEAAIVSPNEPIVSPAAPIVPVSAPIVPVSEAPVPPAPVPTPVTPPAPVAEVPAPVPPTKSKPLNMAGEVRPERPKASPAPEFASLPPKSQEVFNAAYEAKDQAKLGQVLDPANKAWRAEFEKRTGLKLAKTIKGTKEQISAWAATPTQTGGDVSEGPQTEVPKEEAPVAPSQGAPAPVADKNELLGLSRKLKMEADGLVSRVNNPATPPHQVVESRKLTLDALNSIPKGVTIKLGRPNQMPTGTDLNATKQAVRKWIRTSDGWVGNNLEATPEQIVTWLGSGSVDVDNIDIGQGYEFFEQWREAAVKLPSQPSGTQNITNSVLKGQKDNLLGQIDRALENAPEEGTDRVTFSVPGDGEWTTFNTQTMLKRLREKIAKEFPSGVGGDKTPTLPSVKAKSITPVSSKVGDKEILDALKLLVSDDPARESIHHPWSDGENTVATNGRSMMVFNQAVGGTVKDPVILTGAGKTKPADGQPPNYKQVIPKETTAFATVDTAEISAPIKQVLALWKDQPRGPKDAAHHIALHLNTDGSLGYSTDLPGGEESYEHNLAEGSRVIMRVDAHLLNDLVQAARRLGQEKVKFASAVTPETKSGAVPLVILADKGKTVTGVLMPVKFGEADGVSSKVLDKFVKGQGSALKPQHQRLLSAAQKKGGIQALLRRVKARVMVVDSPSELDLATLRGAVATIGHDGEIVIIREAMDRALDAFATDAERQRFLESILSEEALHVLIDSKMDQKEVEAVWNSLSDHERVLLESSYAPDVAKSELSAYQLGHEYLRQFLQRKIFGTRTEAHQLGSTIFDRMTEKLLAALKKIAEIISVGIGKNLTPEVDAALNRLLDALASDEVLKTGIQDAPSQRPAALVTTAQRLDQELGAGLSLPPIRVQTINHNAATQNFVAVGHVHQTWFRLPKEIKAHLEFIQSRLAAMGDAFAALGGPISGDLNTLVASTPEVDQQTNVRYDSQLNMMELRVDRITLGEKLLRLQAELDDLNSKGAAVPNPQNIAINPVKALNQNAISHEQNNLLAQAATATDPTPFYAKVRQLQIWLTSLTAPTRIINALAAGQPVNFAAMGVSPSDGAELVRIYQAYPNLQAELTAVNARVKPTAVTDLEKTIADVEKAIDFMDNRVLSDPVFLTNEEQAATAVGVRYSVVKDGEIGLKFELPDGEWVSVPFQLDSRTSDENERTLERVLMAYERYVDPAITPDAIPGKVETYQQQIVNIRRFYLNPFWNSGRDHSGKLVPGHLNLFDLATFGGWLGTPERIGEGIGGFAAGVEAVTLRNLVNAMAATNMALEREHSAVDLLVDKAWKEHKHDGILSRDMWIKYISDPVFASHREQGTVALDTGSTYLGRGITALDMKAIHAQKQLADAITNAARKTKTEQNRMLPLKIQVRGKIDYERDPQGGPLTVPAYQSPLALQYASAFLAIEEKKLDPVARRQAYLDLFGGVNSPIFESLIAGHIRSAWDTPTYAKNTNSPFRAIYRKITELIDFRDPQAPLSVDAVVTFISRAQVANGQNMLHPDEILDLFIKELSKTLSSVGARKEVEKYQGEAGSNIDITSADNFFTKPRGEQVLPATLLSYSLGDRQQQNRVKGAVYEALGQKWVNALRALDVELTRQQVEFQERVDALKAAGKSVRKATQQVNKESHQEVVDGLNWLEYAEISYHQKRVRRQIQYLADYANAARNYEDDTLAASASIFRKGIVGPLMQAPHTVFRNRLGGTLRFMQLDVALGHAARMGGVRIPGPKIITTLVTRPIELISNAGKLGALTPWFSHHYFQTPKGQLVRQAITNNPQSFGWLARWFVDSMNRQAKTYQMLYDNNRTGMSPFGKQVAEYIQLFWEGGIPRGQAESMPKKMVRGLESIVGLLTEFGLLSGIPRNALSKYADLTINLQAHSYGMELVAQLENRALIALDARVQGGNPPNQYTQFTPKELTGGMGGTEKQAALARLLFKRAGIQLDGAMVDYYRRVEEARKAGQPTDQIRLLDKAQENSFGFVLEEEFNRGGFGNRPQALTSTEFGRTFGALLGYGIGFNAILAREASHFSKSPTTKGHAEGILAAGAMLLLLVAIGGSSEEITRLLTYLTYGEERQTPRLANAESPQEAFSTMFKNSGPYLPMLGGVVNYMTESVKPGTGFMGGGLSFLPVSTFQALLDATRESIQTGDPKRPMVAFAKKFWPNSKVVLNRLPYNEGATDYYNVNRTLRASTPSDIEYVRASGTGGTFRRSTTSDNVANVVNAINRPDGPDWETALYQRDLGIAQKASEGVRNPERAFDQAVLQKTPFKAVYGRKITDDERERIVNRLTPDQQGRLDRVETAFGEYASRVGIKTAGSRASSEASASLDLLSGGGGGGGGGTRDTLLGRQARAGRSLRSPRIRAPRFGRRLRRSVRGRSRRIRSSRGRRLRRSFR